MRNTNTENIAEHSLQVAMISHMLAHIKNLYFHGSIDQNKVMEVSLYHDANEVLTSDLPTPVKYFNPEIKEAYKKIESIASYKLLSMLPEDMKHLYEQIFFCQDEEINALVKISDKISAYIKCLEEEKTGNTEFKKAKEFLYEQIEASNLPEVQYFIQNFLPSFSLTLDEMD
jgi:5'-deoxynucleotidase